MERVNGHIGLVVGLGNGTAQIRFLRKKQCANCGACLTAGENEMEVTLENTLGAQIGDRVAVELSSKRVVQASLLAYAVPLVLLIGGVLIGSRIADWMGLVLGIAACGLGYLILHAAEKRNRKTHRYQPHIVSVLEDGEETDCE